MTQVSTERGDLAGLDKIDIDALALPFYEERAQPRHVAGYVDWRLSGRLARLILSGRFAGRAGEVVLMSALGRLRVKRIFLFGLGRPTKDAALGFDLSGWAKTLIEAGATEVALAPPAALGGDAPPPREVLSAWQRSSALSAGPLARVVLLDLGGSGAPKEP